MGFRTVIVKSRAKLEVRLNTLILRGDNEKKIFINEINTLIIESTAVAITASLINELIKNNVKIIFCDEKRNPLCELLPYYGSHVTSKRIKNQIAWQKDAMALVWQQIVKQKILCQQRHLEKKGFLKQAALLNEYALAVEINDVTNREGHAAKVYFNCILGENLSRKDGGFLNGCLNYGYSVLLSAFNREIVSAGYLTQLGIWHDNEFNQFNLACDFMEPLRVVVDELACSLPEGDLNFKKIMANLLNFETEIAGKNTTLDVAIRQYVRSCISAIEEVNVSKITFPQRVKIINEL